MADQISMDEITRALGAMQLQLMLIQKENDRLKRVIAEYKESKGENNGAK